MQIQGFFKDKKGNLKAHKNSCAECKLYKYAETYKMEPYGNYKKFILNLGQNPGAEEDKTGKPWQGKVGRILQRTYRRLGIDLFDDCLNINACNCLSPNNRKPTKKEITCCRNVMVTDSLYENQPKLIMLFGGSALESFLGHRWKDTLYGITRWRGYVIPDRDFKCWVAPVFHPSFVARNDEEVERLWIRDIQNALDHLDKPLPDYRKPKIEFIDDLSVLYDIKSDLTAFDFETTGLKPHASGHRVVSCAIADTPDHAYAFFIPEKRKDQYPLLDYLSNPEIGKVAANLKFEETWSRVRLKQKVRGWKFDTMLSSHVLDNRKHVTGLKFSVYVNYGIIDYSSDVNPYIHHDGSGNDFNRIFELIETEKGREQLLTYNAYDSIYELRLALQQIEQMDYDFLPNVY